MDRFTKDDGQFRASAHERVVNFTDEHVFSGFFSPTQIKHITQGVISGLIVALLLILIKFSGDDGGQGQNPPTLLPPSQCEKVRDGIGVSPENLPVPTIKHKGIENEPFDI